ncbi:hypothetical protein ABTX85_19985 [Streptomyces sp. NPDC096097]|uniref:hypothetical protein n=1 Tax=Streptomyces sp. NPDC096097 TaxID=3155546 RepID=UPI0033200BAC
MRDRLTVPWGRRFRGVREKDKVAGRQGTHAPAYLCRVAVFGRRRVMVRGSVAAPRAPHVVRRVVIGQLTALPHVPTAS